MVSVQLQYFRGIKFVNNYKKTMGTGRESKMGACNSVNYKLGMCAALVVYLVAIALKVVI